MNEDNVTAMPSGAQCRRCHVSSHQDHDSHKQLNILSMLQLPYYPGEKALINEGWSEASKSCRQSQGLSF